MASEFQISLDGIYSDIRYDIINLICRTVLYGIYLCLAPIAIYVMVANGLQSRSRKWLLAMTSSVFALSTVYWTLSVVFTFIYIDSLNNMATACYGEDDLNASLCLLQETVTTPTSVRAAAWLKMLDDILLVNYIIADGVMVWRAWVLCSDQSRIVLMTPVTMLVINSVIYLMTVTMRAIRLNVEDGVLSFHILQKYKILTPIMNITQVAHLTLSLLINISATSIIALKAWKYRKSLRESGIGVRIPTQGIKILALLVESGMIYILIGVTSLVSIIISLRLGNAGIPGLLLRLGIQLVGIYPLVVVLLVEKNRSLGSTYPSFGAIFDVRESRPSQTEPISIAPASVLTSGG